ncbi:pentapeptide repeat-containing protein [Metabacillus litoralis]|uniref:pentapeptide repeat-containing protein n=1 Tax=Metabacillus litoralis TaxID=152268 RepID=UPI001CFC757B|nr:pentapeptide repeat-containing protein [Metabacillus litoralis]
MSDTFQVIADNQNHLKADCEKCFGLCCVALPYAKSSDFAHDKDSGTPCSHLQSDFRCGIHRKLRNKGYKGCTVYECFGAGQKVSQILYKGKDWRENPTSQNEMFSVFPIMQQLHEMICYLNEAIHRKETITIYHELHRVLEKTEALTFLSTDEILALDIPSHRAMVNNLLLKTSELVRSKVKFDTNHIKQKNIRKGNDFVGANLRGANFRGSNLRGALLIASDLREADLRMTDLIGADLRDANLSGANLRGSIFLTQAQINSANGDKSTKLPDSLSMPNHWIM